MAPLPPILWALALVACTSTGHSKPHAASDTAASIPTGQPGGGIPAGTTSVLSDTGTPPEPAPLLELGQGELEHVPLGEGDTLWLVLGGQGGWHVETSARATHLGPELAIDARLELPDGTPIGSTELTAYQQLTDYDPVADTGWFAGVRAILAVAALNDVCPLRGQPLTLCAVVTSVVDSSRSAEACVGGVAQLPAYEDSLCGSR